MLLDKKLGYCKECGTTIRKSHSLKQLGYNEAYECPYCKYPNGKEDLWDRLPDYLIKYRKKNGLGI